MVGVRIREAWSMLGAYFEPLHEGSEKQKYVKMKDILFSK